MNFNYSYRAFLITSLMVGSLVLLMLSVKLYKKEQPEEEAMAVEYAEDILEEELAIVDTEHVKIETHSAYNEAEQFIRELENERTENGDDSSQEADDSEIDTTSNDLALSSAKDQLKKVKEELSKKSSTKNDSKETTSSSSRKTTINYSLKGRNDLSLPNPVYTCQSGGKIVVNIEVNALGKVVKTSYNKSSSTTTNGCLIESALEYAKKAKFTTKGNQEKQIGTISYHFPGQ